MARDADLPAPFRRLVSDHPLTQLTFRNQGLINQEMRIEPFDTNVLFSEDLEAWHIKGKQPYEYVLRGLPEELLELPDPDSLQAPPSGIRSAPSLGGLGTGTIELRTDGSLANWQLFNNSPGNRMPKIHLPGAFFGIRTQQGTGAPHALALRTTPPARLPGVLHIAGSGGFPVTRLRFADPLLPLATELFAYGSFDMQDLSASMTPAVVFTFLLSNPASEAISTSLMFSLPNVIEGTFRTEHGLVLTRSGDTYQSGELSMSLAAGSPAYSMVSPELTDIWEVFEENGAFRQANGLGLFESGAIGTEFLIEPGASRAVSFILSWRFPNRSIAGEEAGNRYSSIFSSTRNIAQETERALPGMWNSMLAWQSLCEDNALPSPVQDALMNSLSQLYKTTFCAADGRWRNWDSFANPSISSLDAHLHRVFPLLFFFPDVLRNQLLAYATSQRSGGQIVEYLGLGQRYPLDAPGEAACLTKTPIFFILTYLYYCHTGDKGFLQDLWPHIQKALDWQLSITTPEGLPSNLPRLGDWQAMEREGIDLRDAMLHLTGLTAILHLSREIGMSNSVTHLPAIIQSGRSAVDTVFWNENHYQPHSIVEERSESRANQDALIGFILPLMLGMNTLVNTDYLDRHLEYVRDTTPLTPEASRREQEGERTIIPSRTMHWSALHALVNGSSGTGLSVLTDLLESIQQNSRDGWGFYEQLTLAGLPWANPNHASHQSIWYVLLALSGQHYEAPSRRLRFTPRMPRGSKLPFFIPAAQGMMTIHSGRSFTIEVISGRLILDELHIGADILHRDVYLEAGQSLSVEG